MQSYKPLAKQDELKAAKREEFWARVILLAGCGLILFFTVMAICRTEVETILLH